MERIETIVLGAGVVGLAVARALAMDGREVLVIEAESGIGQGTSSRNSEVIHAGLYYTPGSLKARLCVDGKRQLYDYCASHRIDHRRCGKLIVATHADQLPKLDALQAQARANGVDDLIRLSASEAQALEPALRCVGALRSPSTGIVDTHALMLALQGDAEAHGALFAFKSRVCGGQVLTGLNGAADGILLNIDGDEPSSLAASLVVNCAGLAAPALATSIQGFPAAHVPPAFYAKGSYFTLSGRSPFSQLIYPLPEAAGLGVHLTLDLGGQARFGPDVEWVDEIDYRVDPARGEAFYAEVRKYWPDLADDALAPGYAGVRPKIGGPASATADFRIDGPNQHGVPGLVNLFGIESPGLTAALAIAEHVRERTC